MYREEDLVAIGKRVNNQKRSYLVIDPLQGKHIPVEPGKALGLFDALAAVIADRYQDERLLLIGFAETATAIGAETAIRMGAKYIQTTREQIPGHTSIVLLWEGAVSECGSQVWFASAYASSVSLQLGLPFCFSVSCASS